MSFIRSITHDKKTFYYCLTLIIIFSFLSPNPIKSIASVSYGNGNDIPSYTPKLKILEIIDNGSSILAPILGSELNKFDHKVMTMKRFVALRDELDGQYDIIAIMEGSYSSAEVSGKTHNTTNVKNDITNLRADEIITKFIEKNQPVILDSVTMKAKSSTILRSKFGDIDKEYKSNIIYYNSNGNDKDQELISHLRNFLKKDYIPRPRFELTQKPDPEKTFTPGESLSFTLNVLEPEDVRTKDLKARLYIDSDFNDRYEPDELVAEKPITTKASMISYKLPKGYSGLRYWKLELIDNSTNLKEYQKGLTKFKDQLVDLKVLQIMKDTNTSSSLKYESNMKQSKLYRDGEYRISIDTTNMSTFNGSTGKYSHSNINGSYDMVIFGFADVYNGANINNNAVASLKKYIESKQSVMFTHDTIYSSGNNWVNNFTAITGQKTPRTDLGVGAPNTSTKTAKVNEGLITNYPFRLDDNVQIATTHNQYYTLDLEDPEVIPWYNIISEDRSSDKRDVNDSWNHYYTYSKGNITYSGTGHTSTGFPIEEQELFVNTMYRAFLGSNHAPAITVLSPADQAVIPSNQNIELSYQVQDYDLKDKKINTKVYLNDKLVDSKTGIPSGTTLTNSIQHSMPDGGNAVLKIVASDDRGAVSEKTVTLKVEKLQTHLDVNRTVNKTGIIKTREELVITYEVTPKDITGLVAAAVKGDTIVISGPVFREEFPKGIEVLSNGVKTGTAASGVIYTKTLENIIYKRQGTIFKAEPVTFTVGIRPAEKETYILKDSSLKYNDANNKSITAEFNPLTITTDIELRNLIFPESFVLNKGNTKNFALDLQMDPGNAGIKDVQWSDESSGSIIKLDRETGTAEAVREGSTYIRVRVTDVFGTVKEIRSLVTVRIPVEFKAEDITLHVDETKPLPIKVLPNDEARNSLELVPEDGQSVVKINKTDFTVTGLKEGETILTVSGVNSEGVKDTQKITITVKEVPVTKINVDPDKIDMNKYETAEIKASVEPSNATNRQLNWEVADSTIVEYLGDGKIKGIGTGSTKVIISTPNGRVKAEVTVNVGQPLLGISLPKKIEIEKGKFTSITNYLVRTPKDATNVNEDSFQYVSKDPYYAEIQEDGKILGNRIGSSEIWVSVKDDKGKEFKASCMVQVVMPKEEDHGDSLY
ncbi:DUF5057 domain-containing protein [Peribacillus deserti]|uniref:DUF5057 domain-containing protein n=1 Tax=Peribacillus deserti TaxID=673318 RepID=UPI0015E0D6F3|nr:DUF5057 domain-containing protein [Peribacillus deserti]